MPSEDIVISVKNLTKTYRLFDHPGDRIKQFLSLGFKQYHRGFTALNDVSFDIKKGETIGIIGRNGSGKSTLLQLICGILKPTSGTVTVNGRISALLELGAGFNPEFTGRENVYFQGALMGFTKEQMDERFDEIASFADIGEFIDQPVRTYSSGMFVRLAFSVSINTDPEVLILDEALGVGDIAFQRKCFHRLERFIARGGTSLFVSHNLEDIRRQCTRTLMITEGQLTEDGPSKSVTEAYEKYLFGYPAATTLLALTENNDGYGSREAIIEECHINYSDKSKSNTIRSGELFTWTFTVLFHRYCEAPVFSMLLTTTDGISVYGTEAIMEDNGQHSAEAGERIRVTFHLCNPLLPGIYFLNAGIKTYRAEGMVFLHRQVSSAMLRVYADEAPLAAVGLTNLSAKVTFEAL